MKTKLYIALYITAFVFGLAGFFLFPSASLAANLEVHFESDPLFEELNFLPGSMVEKFIEVRNNSETEQEVIIEAINATDKDGLGDVIELHIKRGEETFFDDTLGAFLRRGETSLGTLGPGSETTYDLVATFTASSGNEYQEGTIGFDLCVGFEGGSLSCGDTAIGGEGDTSSPGDDGNGDDGGTIQGSASSGGGSGGGGNGPVVPDPLKVFEEDVTDADFETGTALLLWQTNYLATSQVIYGAESGAPYTLDLALSPYYGYPLGTEESSEKAMHHSVLLTGLVPGESYRFRVVSRASPPTVGIEYIFTFGPKTAHAEDADGSGESSSLSFPGDTAAPPGGSADIRITPTSAEPGSGPGDGSGGLDGDSQEGKERRDDNEAGSIGEGDTRAGGALPAGLFSLPQGAYGWALLLGVILLLVFFIIVFLLRRKKKNE